GAGCAVGDLLRQKMQRASLTFMVEENAATNMHAVAFAVDLRHLMRINFSRSVGVDRIKGSLLVLLVVHRLTKHFGGRCLIDANPRAVVPHRLEQPDGSETIDHQGLRGARPRLSRMR